VKTKAGTWSSAHKKGSPIWGQVKPKRGVAPGVPASSKAEEATLNIKEGMKNKKSAKNLA